METGVEVPLQQRPHLAPLQPAATATRARQHHFSPALRIGQSHQLTTGALDQAKIGHFKGTMLHRKAEQPVAEVKNVIALS